MTPAILHALTIDAARPIIRAKWPTACSTERIASECGISTLFVRRLAREMGLPERVAGRRKAA